MPPGQLSQLSWKSKVERVENNNLPMQSNITGKLNDSVQCKYVGKKYFYTLWKMPSYQLEEIC